MVLLLIIMGLEHLMQILRHGRKSESSYLLQCPIGTLGLVEIEVDMMVQRLQRDNADVQSVNTFVS